MSVALSPKEVLDKLGISYRERSNRLVINCLFHHDTNPSSGFYLDTKLFHCYACELTLTTVDFYARVRGWTREQAEAEVGEVPPPAIDRLAVEVVRARGEGLLERMKGCSRKDHAFKAEQLEKIIWAYQRSQITVDQFKKAFSKWEKST